VVVALVAVAWHLDKSEDKGADQAQLDADSIAAVGADPDDILVDMKDDLSDAQVAQLGKDVGVDFVLVSSESKDERFYRAHVDASREAAVLAALTARPEVEIAEPDATYSLSPDELAASPPPVGGEWAGFPDDPLYKHQWHLDQIGMPEAWKLADGNGVTVAVLDTGVAYENFEQFHQVPDLAGVTFVDGYDFVDNDTHADDDHGHGTHVTGTIAQATNNGIGVAGIARNVKIMPLKVLSGSGSGSVAGIADAIRYAADHGAKVINMSLGGAFPSRVLKKAVAYAHDKGVVVVCAAGNESRGKVGYPAAYPGAIAVAATQFDESTTFYSNYGKDIDVAAPGGNTRVDQNGDGMPYGVLQNTIATQDPSKDDYYGYMGTSMASPHVAGVAALIVGEGVTDPDAVETILKDTSRKPANQNYVRDRYGSGIIDAPAAIRKARGETGGWQLGLGLLIAGAIAASARKRGLGVKLGPSYLMGAVIGASGLFFLPWISSTVAQWPGIATLTRGMPSWDLSILGAAGHGNALFFSALVPMGLLAMFYGVRRLRAPLAGFAAGVAGHLAFFAAVPMTTIQHMPTIFGISTIWLALNAIACIFLARLALRK